MNTTNQGEVGELALSEESGSESRTVLEGPAPDSVPGIILRRERRLAEITTVAMARALGITRQMVWIIERDGAISAPRAAAYRAALAELVA